ncbi:MAG: hypothetical protein FD156_2696 [Nitrospirae bacterium]|nr:MAG: hypothetical protein FD156_2696 [Nitrospirota bacterium]
MTAFRLLRYFSTVLNSLRYILETYPSGSDSQGCGRFTSLRTVTKKSLMPLKTIIFNVLFVFILLSHIPAYSFMSDTGIASFQKEIAGKPVGERIALWAEKFVGTPYDPDPLGEYVTKKVIVADERADCMYLSFRAVELAMSLTPEEAVIIALDKRFINRGKLGNNGKVLNYEDRFQYGEDMIDSGRWGREITEEFGKVTEITGSRGRKKVKMVLKEDLLKSLRSSKSSSSLNLRDGDFIFFIKAVEKRKVGEIVGHIGIVKTEVRSQSERPSVGDSTLRVETRIGKSEVRNNEEQRAESKDQREIYLIHAGGLKNKGGEVKKIRFSEYINSMPFIGIRVSRFN